MKVVSNTAVSIDGRIATAAYEHQALGTPTDRQYMSVLRARADAVLVGGKTFRNWPLPLVPNEADLRTLREQNFFDHEAPSISEKTWFNAIVTRSLDLPQGGRFWGDPRVKPLVFSNSAGALPGLLVGPTDAHSVAGVLRNLGVKNLLLECGGDLLAQWLAAGLVDEVYATVCPLVLGGRGAPTLADGPGFSFADAPRFSLVHAQPVGSEVYLKYRRKATEP